MKRATRTSLTIAMATVMIGFAVTQARADRVSYTVDRCFGAGCLAGSVKIGELSLAFTESSLGVVDSAASATALANFSPEMSGVSGLSFGGASVRSQGSAGDASATQRSNAYQANTSSLLLPAAGMSLSFSRMQTPIFANTIDLGRVSTTSNSSFSVTGTDLKVSKTTRPYSSTDANPGGGDGLPPGGAPVPEPTTMLLLGTGLAGAAAVVRKRLKARGRISK
jgi:hypothetical protein